MVSRQPQSKPDKSFFPQAVPARQPMADIYVRLRDLAVPRMGRNYVEYQGRRPQIIALTRRTSCSMTLPEIIRQSATKFPSYVRCFPPRVSRYFLYEHYNDR